MFEGFRPETFEYLDQLGMNNSKSWFDANRERYLELLRKPFEELVSTLAPHMQKIDQNLDVDPKRCIARINRDVRFSKDKSPYRTNLWLAFKQMNPDWKAAPAWYFEVFPDHWRYGMGFFETSKPVITAIRTAISEREPGFMELHRRYQQQGEFKLEGLMFKRILDPSLPPELMAWNQRKEFYFVSDHPVDGTLMGPVLVQRLMEGFESLIPWYRYWMNLYEIGRGESDR